jgi:hypothetical protein
MAESVLFQICSRNSVCRLVFSLAFTTVGSWWSQWESCDREVTIIHATADGPWTGARLALLFILLSCLIFFWFRGPFLSVLSFLLWNSLWLVEEVLTLLCLFLIVRMGISWFLWEIQFDHTYMYQLYYCQLWEHFWTVLLVSFLSLWQRQTWCSVDTHLFRIANEPYRALTGFCDISWSAFLEGIFRVLL